MEREGLFAAGIFVVAAILIIIGAVGWVRRIRRWIQKAPELAQMAQMVQTGQMQEQLRQLQQLKANGAGYLEMRAYLEKQGVDPETATGLLDAVTQEGP